MAEYHYDESGSMAAYFLLTFLLVVLIPLTMSSSSVFSRTQDKDGCPCQECVNHRANLRPSVFSPKARRRLFILTAGWSIFAFVVYKVASSKIESKVYNPFEILDISMGTSVKEIKSHYKKLSRKFHPDKVKLGINDTIEAVEARFVEITKAYKALTDQTIRENWEKYGHPDGRQEVSMGIALPKTIIEGRNRMLVLAAYGLVFGGMLPALVGRWWFGNRDKTKDGVNARSAAVFFKTLGEESGLDDVVASLGKSFEYERPSKKGSSAELDELEKEIQTTLGAKWTTLKNLAEVEPKQHEARRRAFVLLYAHLLRLPIQSSALRKEQADILLTTPALLNSLLNIVLSRNWLWPTLAAMRLHAYLSQALLPGEDTARLAQLPGIKQSEAKELARELHVMNALPEALEKKDDGRAPEIKKALSRWGKLDVVDASFKVIGERVVSPLSIVFLVVKLRIVPPTGSPAVKSEKDDVAVPVRDRAEEEFLTGRKDAEDMPKGLSDIGFAHAPHWPANRKPSWWIVLADPKIGKVIVPPMKITDVPLADAGAARDWRAYKMQFQAPQQAQTLQWKLHLVSDTFVGEEVVRDITLRIEEAGPGAADEDEISDPEEDSLAGQMAMMRGGRVKPARAAGDGSDDESDDDESSTDDDKKAADDDSDSDSD
ncbi:DnaJ-domain-containing protein [Phanerochaete sordida]|uniref:DnaJ-domain-containing protein n=1 Tax=Phanerochaete sordida TaxID=48140 RepID=A0A9P3L7G2_9APHY|nr:DnaJ-domain-containing protein [Phanerochaete sordida]